MRKKTFKTQADLFSYVLDEFVEDEETCIGEFCIKNKSQAYENLKIKRNHLAEEWNRLTEERENQIRAEVIEEFKEYLLRHKKLVREFKTNHVYESVKIEFITDTTAEQLKEQKND